MWSEILRRGIMTVHPTSANSQATIHPWNTPSCAPPIRYKGHNLKNKDKALDALDNFWHVQSCLFHSKLNTCSTGTPKDETCN